MQSIVLNADWHESLDAIPDKDEYQCEGALLDDRREILSQELDQCNSQELTDGLVQSVE